MKSNRHQLLKKSTTTDGILKPGTFIPDILTGRRVEGGGGDSDESSRLVLNFDFSSEFGAR